jgi:ATP-dependent DNA helicase RecG
MSGKKYKVFISSVQKEFEHERAALQKYLSTDVLLKSFFEAFIFEGISATSSAPELVFMDKVK